MGVYYSPFAVGLPIPGNFESYFKLAIDFATKHWFLLILGVYVSRCIQLRYFHRLSHIPGPFLASFTDLYAAFVFISGKQEQIEWDLHQKYGPVVRFSPRHVLISDPKVLPQLFHRTCDKTNYQDVGSLGLNGSTFASLSDKEHTRLKKRVAGAYSMTSVRKMEGIVNERILEFIEKIDSHSQKGPLDYADWTSYIAYDIVSELGFGRAFGFVRTASDVYGLIRSFHHGLPLVGTMMRLRHVTDFICSLPGFRNLLNASPDDKDGIGAVMGFRDKLIRERIDKGNINGRDDMLQFFLNSKNSDGTSMTFSELGAETISLMLAGSDTTATVLRFFMKYLVENENVYNKLVAEIDEAYDSGKMTRPVPTYDECTQLPYFTAVFKETLRLSTPLPCFMLRVVDGSGINVNGVHIPPGTHAGMNGWVVNRNEDLYGPDSFAFRPERWLESDSQRALFDKYEYSWGYGSRKCLGKNIALLEIYKICTELLRRFKPVYADAPPGAKYDRYLTNMGVWVERGLWMRFMRRNVTEWEEK